MSWSHFKVLLRVKDAQAKAWYAAEAAAQGWSVRALDRQINTLFYERLLGSQDKAGVTAEAVALIAKDAPPDPRDFIRDPYVLEFLGAQPDAGLYDAPTSPAPSKAILSSSTMTRSTRTPRKWTI